MSPGKPFSPSGNERVSRLAFEAALRAEPTEPKDGDNALHVPSGLRVAILRRGYGECHVRFPRGAEMSISNALLRGETYG